MRAAAHHGFRWQHGFVATDESMLTGVAQRWATWQWKSSVSIPVGLGGSAFGWIVLSGATDAILDRFFDIGGRFIDTSDGYSYAARPQAEDLREPDRILGETTRCRKRNRIITKVGLCPGVEGLALR